MNRRLFAGISLWLWLLWGMQLAIGTLLTVSGWFMAADLRTPAYVQLGLVLLGASVGQIAYSLYGMWQWRVAWHASSIARMSGMAYVPIVATTSKMFGAGT
ncbi:MAG TPA: hypothetical protein VJS30_20210 [Paraburkholderia sp.]|nr:hypothetical protein [Paraburkholderia sp.]